MGKEWDSFKQGRAAKYTNSAGFNGTGTGTGRSQDNGDYSWFGSAAQRPNYSLKVNPRCTKCNHYQFSGTPCKCEIPEWKLDHSVRETFITFMTEVFTEALRVLKPGGHAFVWALPRTSHWTALALEDAGFEIRDEVSHLFGSDSKVQAFMASLNDEQRNAFAQVIGGMSEPAALLHMFGSGFPKSSDTSKQIDKHLRAEREVVGPRQFGDGRQYLQEKSHENGHKPGTSFASGRTTERLIDTAPATPEAQQWNGWGSALKPSHECWLLCRKPLAEPSIAANVLTWGVGAINVDASRIGTSEIKSITGVRNGGIWNSEGDGSYRHNGSGTNNPQGRFPSNTLLSHTLLCQPRGEKRVHVNDRAHVIRSHVGTQGYGGNTREFGGTSYADSDGMETVAAYDCSEDCPIFLLDQQSGMKKSNARPNCYGNTYRAKNKVYGDLNTTPYNQSNVHDDQGGASRYFQCFPYDDMPPFIYTSKASRAERNRGCEALPEREAGVGDVRVSGDMTQRLHPERGDIPPVKHQNTHPTVKPISLLSYLTRMITPPNGVVLDMFAGSGSTGVACVQNGFRYILIEQEQEYVDIIHARLAHAHQAMPVQEQEYECVPECPVRILGEQSGVRKSGAKRRMTSIGYGIEENHTFDREVNHESSTGKADRFFKTFPPDSLFAGMEEEAL